MARAKKVDAVVDPNAWTEKHDELLKQAEGRFKEASDHLRMLQAAKFREISYAELKRRIEAEHKRQDKIIERLKAAVEQLGGTIHSSSDDGVFGVAQYGWCFTFKTNVGHTINFNYGRGMEADAYDLPLSFQWRVHFPKKRGSSFVGSLPPEKDGGYIDCENVGEFKRYVKRAVKWLNDTYGDSCKKEIKLA